MAKEATMITMIKNVDNDDNDDNNHRDWNCTINDKSLKLQDDVDNVNDNIDNVKDDIDNVKDGASFSASESRISNNGGTGANVCYGTTHCLPKNTPNWEKYL